MRAPRCGHKAAEPRSASRSRRGRPGARRPAAGRRARPGARRSSGTSARMGRPGGTGGREAAQQGRPDGGARPGRATPGPRGRSGARAGRTSDQAARGWRVTRRPPGLLWTPPANTTPSPSRPLRLARPQGITQPNAVWQRRARRGFCPAAGTRAQTGRAPWVHASAEGARGAQGGRRRCRPGRPPPQNSVLVSVRSPKRAPKSNAGQVAC
jgi:hypothetical protein